VVKTLKTLIHFTTRHRYIAISQKWLKIDRYKQRGVLQALNPCQKHRNMYPSIFNRFPVIQPVSSNVRHFSTFFEHFCLPWVAYAPGTFAINVIWMKRGFNACQTHHSMRLSISNRFPVIQPVSSNVRHFSTFFAHFGLHFGLGRTQVRPRDNRDKHHMVGKRIQCL